MHAIYSRVFLLVGAGLGEGARAAWSHVGPEAVEGHDGLLALDAVLLLREVRGRGGGDGVHPGRGICGVYTAHDKALGQLRRLDDELAVLGPRRDRRGRAAVPGWNSNLQPDFNGRVIDRFGPASSAVLRELDESHRSVQKSAESTSM